MICKYWTGGGTGLEEKFPALFLRVLRAGHSVSNSPITHENLIVITTLECLVAEEVDLVELGSVDVAEAEGLVPALGENVE